MKIGVPKEIKTNENRVGVTPAGVEALVSAGHSVLVQNGAGDGSGFDVQEYYLAGASIMTTAESVWKLSDMIIKVKEPIAPEWPRMKKDQVIFTYFHFAADRTLTEAHLKSGATCIAYETVELPDHSLPLLVPMSEVAGSMATHEGAKYLEKIYGGRGILLGGVTGTARGKVVVLGGGIVGLNAAKKALGMGASVVILDASLPRLRYLRDILPEAEGLVSNRENILKHIKDADLVIGGVLIPGAAAPKLIRHEDLKTMKPGAVIVDVAIDQGGCVETMRPTTHKDPIFLVDGIVHYGVANMPGAFPRTSTIALTNATLPYALELANKGWIAAVQQNEALLKGLNIISGKVTYKAVAEAFGLHYYCPKALIQTMTRNNDFGGLIRFGTE
ncbi:MAG: alanine dehydrogenase [Candidatus Paceibacterota bacterium]|jgi:alanine dehydrogenase|nr:alanine dehydrogenase [Candidatus Paceibacterota bacterium]